MAAPQAAAHFALQAGTAYLCSAPLQPAIGTDRINPHEMRNEIQNIVDEIKQAISLLRRHL
jgi:hypothetical protein